MKRLNKITVIIITACVFLTCFLVGTRAFFPIKYKNEINSACRGVNIDENLVFAVIKAESSFKKDKVSKKGAIGLMQIMPDTAEFISTEFFGGRSYDLFSPEDNILFGVTYLLYLIEKFEDEKTALAAYNAGEGRVLEWLENKDLSKDGKTLFSIPFNETDKYVKRVLKFKKVYKLLN